MSKLLLLAVLRYLDSSGDELFCDAVVICDPGKQSCHAHPIEQCAGNYDQKRVEPLSGKWNMGQCLTSDVLIGQTPVSSLGCTTDMREVDVDRDAVLAASKPK